VRAMSCFVALYALVMWVTLCRARLAKVHALTAADSACGRWV
jgi:hypothetical protein